LRDRQFSRRPRNHGLEELAKLPKDRKRQHTEIELRLALASTLIASKGYAAFEVRREFERARELAEKIDDQGSLVRSMFEIFLNQTVRDDVSLAVDTAQRLLKLAEACHDPGGRCIGHYCISQSSFQAAALSTATEHFQ
jgi:hypothetical protein